MTEDKTEYKEMMRILKDTRNMHDDRILGIRAAIVLAYLEKYPKMDYATLTGIMEGRNIS